MPWSIRDWKNEAEGAPTTPVSAENFEDLEDRIGDALEQIKPGLNVLEYAVGDGAADDWAALQGLLDGAPETLIFPKATYLITQPLQVYTGTRIYGYGALIVADDAFPDFPVIQVAAAETRVLIDGLEILGNKFNRVGHDEGAGVLVFGEGAPTFPIEDVELRNLTIHDTPGIGIEANYTNRLKITNCHVYDAERDGIAVYFNCRNVVISGNHVHDCNGDHIALNSQESTATSDTIEHFLVEGNIIHDTVSGNGITVRGAAFGRVCDNNIRDTYGHGILVSGANAAVATDFDISGNVIYRAGIVQGGISPLSQGISVTAPYGGSINNAAGARRIRISENVIVNPLGRGVHIHSGGASFVMENITVSENDIDQTGTPSTTNGILLTGTADGEINDVDILYNRVGNGRVNPIQLGDNTVDINRPTVLGNRVYNAATGAGNGITLWKTDNPLVTGNTVVGESSMFTNGFAILASTGDVVYHGNRSLGPTNEGTHDAAMGTWRVNISHQLSRGGFFVGAGTPEGAVAAPQGSLYLRTDGGTSTTLYVKTSGTTSSGWTAK